MHYFVKYNRMFVIKENFTMYCAISSFYFFFKSPFC